MPITEFSFRNLKVLQYAECKAVPKLMIISGPNGVGKSTLLHALKLRQQHVIGDGRILYIGPHRAWRRQSVRAMYLHGRELDFTDLLTRDNFGHIEGLSLTNQSRTPDSLDEAHSLIKYTLAQIEVRRQSAIAALYDQNGFAAREWIDVYAPLKSLVDVLLPHLSFDRVSFDNRDDVKILFRRIDTPTSPAVDIDDLSSGEKSAIALLLPFLEEEINDQLAILQGSASNQQADLICILDEPELHLHPTLQEKLLDYFRRISSSRPVQFIISTHSPVIINATALDELFLLLPPQGFASYNQLVPATSEISTLEAIRSIAGDMFSLTSGRPLVLVEGANPYDAKDEPSDIRLIQLLSPAFRRFALVSLGDKDRIRHVTQALETVLQPGQGLNVFAITDKDQLPSNFNAIDRVFVWPVTMIENFLLDAKALFEVLEPYREKTNLHTPQSIQAELNRIAAEQVEEEIRLRLASKFHPFRWSFHGKTAEELRLNAQKAKEMIDSLVGDSPALEATITSIRNEVEGIRSNGNALQQFHGKHILKAFFGRFVHQTGLKYKSFCIELARSVGRSGEPAEMKAIRVAIQSYIPSSLRTVLEELSTRTEGNLTALSPLIVSLDKALSSLQRGQAFPDLHQLKQSLLQVLYSAEAGLALLDSASVQTLRESVQRAYQMSLSIRVPDSN